MRSIVVSYSTNILINVMTALVCFRFLQQLGFSLANGGRRSGPAVRATHLHYTQNMMENNYILLLTLTGPEFHYRVAASG